jgi:DNA-binding response OmpR family regulator
MTEGAVNSVGRVLLVEDELEIAELMRDFLVADGFEVAIVTEGGRALGAVRAHEPDCVLLDVMLGDESGFDVCRRIREEAAVPILFLSARDGDADKIRGLGLGADDYVVKSATPAEVVARVRAVLRRYRSNDAHRLDRRRLRFGRLEIDLTAREVAVDGSVVRTTAKEFDLLEVFAEHPRQVFSRDHLFELVWGEYGDRRAVPVYVKRLRQKIERDPAKPECIVTVWGVGYRFDGGIA